MTNSLISNETRQFNCIFFFCISLSPSQQLSASGCIESTSPGLSLSSHTASGSSQITDVTSNKWICDACTFLNQIKSNRCAQCASKRDEPETVSHVQEQINALSIKDHDSELMAVNHRMSPLRSSSLSGSRTNLGAAGNRISPVDNKCYTKWPCSVRYQSFFPFPPIFCAYEIHSHFAY